MTQADADLQIRFDFTDIPSDAMSENYAVGWMAGRWEQYWFMPTPDFWGGNHPIFLAAQEAILHSFGLAPDALSLASLSTTSPATLRTQGLVLRAEDPYYAVSRVTSFVEWIEDSSEAGIRDVYRAERLQTGEWVVAKLDEPQWRWIEGSRKLSDLEMWKLLNDGLHHLLSGRLRTFRWRSLFIAHSSADKEFARTLATRLRSFGVRVWLDEIEIRVGDSLLGRIQTGIDEADFVAVILSPASASSPWVQEEVRMAMARQIGKGETVVLPLLLKDTPIPGFLREKRFADFRDPQMFEAALDDLLSRLREQFPSGSRL